MNKIVKVKPPMSDINYAVLMDIEGSKGYTVKVAKTLEELKGYCKNIKRNQLMEHSVKEWQEIAELKNVELI